MRPLQRDELDPYTIAGMVEGEITWGGFCNNLCKAMAYLPRMCQTEVEYCNTFVFDPGTFRGKVQEAGFNDRFLKELIISRTSLYNRCRYSIRHHCVIGMKLFTKAGREEEGHIKLLHLHEHDLHPQIYTERESVSLDYTVKICEDARLVTDEDFENLRRVLREYNKTEKRLKKFTEEQMNRHVDSQIVELSWLIGHFCHLNRWLTVLQIPDETSEDEDDFLLVYEQIVPEDIRIRNEELLQGGF